MDRAAKYTCLQATFDFDLSFAPRFSIEITLSLKELMYLKKILPCLWTFIIAELHPRAKRARVGGAP